MKKLKTPTHIPSTQVLSGLIPNWKKNKTPQANLSRASSTASMRMTVSHHAMSTVPIDNEDEAIASDGGPAFAYGGIPSDEDKIKHPGLQDGNSLTVKHHVHCLTCCYLGYF